MDILKESAGSNDNADRTDGEMLELSGGYTVEEERAVLRKIDMVILPFVSDTCRCPNVNLSLLTCALSDVFRLFPAISRQAEPQLCWCIRSHRRSQYDELTVLVV
jgi:hypothetical protein